MIVQFNKKQLHQPAGIQTWKEDHGRRFEKFDFIQILLKFINYFKI